MAAAVVGDDVLDGDPTVRELEQAAAARLGKAGALFVPSGTMANQVALGAWTRPGDELIVERHAHIVEWESAGASANHGLQTLTLRAPDGRLALDDVRRSVRAASVHCPRTALIAVEQTYMGAGSAAGGRVVPLEHLRAVRELADELGLPVHMDGARLFNAVTASGVAADAFAACASSVSICLSKGLGAPVGSLIAGDEAFLERARFVRKRLGGWMRQAGHLAAAGLIALEQGSARLEEDHVLARELAAVCEAAQGLSSPPAEVETNMVIVGVAEPCPFDSAELARALGERGVGVMPFGASLRFVTHRDVGTDDVARLEGALAEILTKA
jgi:threonine aldolase